MLTRLPDGFSALVLGASGGIGRAVIDALLASERPGRVMVSAARKPHIPIPASNR
ncbi:hypothetical protein SAMN04487955_10287 [Halomonas korlensis]|uniref:Short chain dehydrogenase n=1 Tax=Halomonas korlensis TaxID=463301 RepID=A0A1I7FXX3_9GAMM|nr:hypothetical protein SAMN04487955_10287 [Halomonas korlensis]